MGDVGEILMSVLSTIRVPKPGDRVHKDECALSFASPVSSFFFVTRKSVLFPHKRTSFSFFAEYHIFHNFNVLICGVFLILFTN